MNLASIIWGMIIYILIILGLCCYMLYDPLEIDNSLFIKELERLEKSMDSLEREKLKLDSVHDTLYLQVDSLTICLHGSITHNSMRLYIKQTIEKNEWLSK